MLDAGSFTVPLSSKLLLLPRKDWTMWRSVISQKFDKSTQLNDKPSDKEWGLDS